MEIKKALVSDSRFRDLLPTEYKKEIIEFLSNPGCPCHIPLYRKIMRNCKEQLKAYFPGKDTEDIVEKMAENNWNVINCSTDDLEKELRKFSQNRIQIAAARFKNDITVIGNILQGESENNWLVINCEINDIEKRLMALTPGRKQIAIARYEDQATIIVNELNIIY